MHNFKALIVEPSPVFQQILQQVLEEQGYESLFVNSGKEAQTMILSDTFDIMCVAMELKDMSGTELCKVIRKSDDDSSTLPIIMITTKEDSSVLQQVMNAGATEVFQKTALHKFSSFLTNLTLSRNLDKKATGHILYIEDSKAQSQLIRALLEEIGHKVTHFTHAEDALAHFNKENYDLVLTDVFLEGKMTGMDLVREIRVYKEYSTIPILAMSALDDASRKLELLRCGANDYISKPIINEELAVRAQNLIKTKRLIDTLEKQQQHLREVAMKDQLTNLYNRHFLMEMAPKKITSSHLHNTNISMLVIDLDHFKLVNDTHGHATGDVVLETVSAQILKSCQEEDIACRFGGEEFILLLSQCDLDLAMKKAEALRASIERLKPADLIVTASIGVSSLHLKDNTDDLGSLFARADQGTYIAKNQGRNQVTPVNTLQ